VSDLAWADVAALLDGAGPAHVATVGADGAPHVAILWAGVEEGHLWCMTTATAVVADQLAARPAIAMVWTGNGAETYVWGRAVLERDQATKERVWYSGLLPFDPAAFFGSPEDPSVLLVRVVPERATVLRTLVTGPSVQRWHA